MAASSRFDTHEVTNQSPLFGDVDLFALDRPLQDAVHANGAGADVKALAAFGQRWGTAEMLDLARQANENPPTLRAFDPHGVRQDFVAFHPAYHLFMAESVGARLQASTWRSDASAAPAPAQVTRAARFYMAAQVETGHLCPITMTRAAVAALVAEPGLAAGLMPKIAAREYDPVFRPWPEKKSMTLGMGMTEKQGGTDVRTNTTRAVAAGDGYAVTGHKWFMSAPMSDAFLVLAQAPGGLSCFLMPRFQPDGSLNGLRIQRLKDKLGNRSNASAEVELTEAFALRVGAEGRGLRTVLQMVQLTRLDCAIASAGLMRMGLAQAIHHARHRVVFQKPLAEQPLMQAVLADMAVEVEGAVALVMRLCRSFDLAAADGREATRARLLTPAVKYLVCKLAPAFIYEAMECLGGNGYVEESILPRLYREAPVNAIWEGSGNVMCLDVLRVLEREPQAAREVVAELAHEAADLAGARGAATFIDATSAAAGSQARARALVERLATLAAAAALRGSAPASVSEIFARTRLAACRTATFGASDMAAVDAAAILQRALPC
jgi:putative acyl-CoA dehydrogenase